MTWKTFLRAARPTLYLYASAFHNRRPYARTLRLKKAVLTGATIDSGAPPFFLRFFNLGAQDLPQKLIFGEKNQNCCCRNENSHGLRYTTRIMQNKMAYYSFIFRRFCAKEPPSLRNHFRKKRYTSIVGRVYCRMHAHATLLFSECKRLSLPRTLSPWKVRRAEAEGGREPRGQGSLRRRGKSRL